MRKLLALAAAVSIGASAACTVHESNTPSPSGPSVNAISLTVTATPDTLPQDGAAQSRIVVKAFNAGGQPLPNLAVRLDMVFNNTAQDFGSLSARTLVTAADGTAGALYTAPTGPGNGGLGTTVAVVATPITSDAVNTGILNAVGARFQAVLHLTPAGSVVPPPTETPTPAFTVTPGSPTAGQIALFNGTTSCPAATCAGANSTISTWEWDFGDGTAHAFGSIVTHQFSVARPYAVTLTVTNSQGKSASLVSVITVGAGTGPVPLFTALPNPAAVNDTVTLDGSPSTGAPINYAWTITSPTVPAVVTRTGGTNPVTTFTPTSAGNWQVNLTVTDANGRSTTSAAQIVIVQ